MAVSYRARTLPCSVARAAAITSLVLGFLLMLALTPAPAAAAGTQRFVGLYQVGNVSQAAQRYSVVVLNEWNSAQISSLKAGNPGLKVLLYKNSFFLRSDDNASTVGGFASGENISVNHPDWFLLDASGNRIVFQYYPGVDFYVMDWGNQEWRAYWTSRSIERARALGFDGVYADDLYTRKYGQLDRSLQRYADNASLQSAVRGFLHYAYGQMSASSPRLLLVGNVVDHLWYSNLWADWLTVSDGLMDEQFVHSGLNAATNLKTVDGWWLNQLAEIETSERMGKISFFVSHASSTDTKSMRYAFGTYMLAAGSRALYYHEVGSQAVYSNPVWDDLWSLDLGSPSGTYVARSDGLYTREFAKGLVVVNPSATATRTLQLSGYVSEDGSPVSSLSVGPASAAFLVKAPTTTTTLAPTTTTTLAPTTTTTVARTTTTLAPTTTTTSARTTTTTAATTTTTPAPPTTTTTTRTPTPTTTTTSAPTPTTTTVMPPTTTTGAPAQVRAQSLPVIQFVKPEDGAVVRGTIGVEVKATSAVGILKVELLVDGAVVGSDKWAPYQFDWNAGQVSEGDHTLLAVAYDRVGNVAGTAITVKSIADGRAKTRAAITASAYRFSGTSAFLNSTGVLYVQ